MNTSFVIFGDIDQLTGEPLFWNNQDGWGSLLSATRFSEKETRTLQLPKCCSNGTSMWVREY